MVEPLRMPISAASRRGISGVAAEAQDRRIVLTSLDRAVAVVDSAERIDESMQTVRAAARLVVESFADKAAAQGEVRTLAEVCSALGIDESAVRERAAELRDQPAQPAATA